MTYIPNTFGEVSSVNSSTLALGIAGSFTGTYEQVQDFSNVAITVIITSGESATLNVDFSIDNIGTNEFTNSRIVTGTGTNNTFSFPIFTEYFRIRILADQGTTATGAVQTIFNKSGSKPNTLTLTDSINDSTNAIMTRSLLSVDNSNGGFITLSASNGQGIGGLNTSIVSPLDSFGRVRVSNPFGIFDSKQLTNNDPFGYDTDTTGTGTANYTLGFPQTYMQVSANGDRVIRQQHGYNIYQPAKSLLIYITGTLLTNTSTTNVRARIGYFDDLNDKTLDDNPTGDGFFFQTIGGVTPVTSVVYRTSNDSSTPPSTPPTQSDTVINQSSWNLDTMDGNGPSGITLDFSKRQIFFINMEWLGVGDVIMGFVVNGSVYPCHVFRFSNGTVGSDPTVAYNCRGSLPVRYELEATGIPSTTATMFQVCSSVISEGGSTPKDILYSIDRGIDLETVGTEEPLISLRLNQTNTSPIRPRVILNVLNVTLFSATNDNVIYRAYIFKNPTAFGGGPLSGGGGPNWINDSTNPSLLDSAAEYDLTANTVDLSGVTYPFRKIDTGYFSASADKVMSVLVDLVKLKSDIAGNSDMMVITGESFVGTANLCASIQWQEFE